MDDSRRFSRDIHRHPRNRNRVPRPASGSCPTAWARPRQGKPSPGFDPAGDDKRDPTLEGDLKAIRTTSRSARMKTLLQIGLTTVALTLWTGSIPSLGGVVITNAGFETPNLGSGFKYDPTGPGVGWTFTVRSGIAANGSGFGVGGPGSGGSESGVQPPRGRRLASCNRENRALRPRSPKACPALPPEIVTCSLFSQLNVLHP